MRWGKKRLFAPCGWERKKFTRAAVFPFFSFGNIFKIFTNCLIDLEQVSKVSKTGNNLKCFIRFIFSNVTLRYTYNSKKSFNCINVLLELLRKNQNLRRNLNLIYLRNINARNTGAPKLTQKRSGRWRARWLEKNTFWFSCYVNRLMT